MTHTIQIIADSPRLIAALQALLKAGNYSFRQIDEAAPLSWEDLTADDYRQMIRSVPRQLKAKSLRNYEG